MLLYQIIFKRVTVFDASNVRLFYFCNALQNFDRTFTHPTPKCGIAAKYPKLETRQELASRYDPKGMFEGSLVQKVFSGASYELTAGCR